MTGFESASKEREAHYPERGYNLVEIDMLKPPGEALTRIGHSLRLSDISIPQTTELTDYVVYDKHGDGYAREDVSEFPTSNGGGEIAELIETIQYRYFTNDVIGQSGGREQRIALAQLAKTVENEPERGVDAIPVLTAELQTVDVELQAESLYILSRVAEEYPEQIRPVAGEVIPLLDQESNSGLLAETIEIIAAIAEYDPDAVVDAVPKLAIVLQDGSRV